MDKKSDFTELERKTKEISRHFGVSGNPNNVDDIYDGTEFFTEIELNDCLLNEIRKGLKVWVFINGNGPLIPQGDYVFKDNKIMFLGQGGSPQQWPHDWPVVFLIPELSEMYVHQLGNWENH